MSNYQKEERDKTMTTTTLNIKENYYEYIKIKKQYPTRNRR